MAMLALAALAVPSSVAPSTVLPVAEGPGRVEARDAEWPSYFDQPVEDEPIEDRGETALAPLAPSAPAAPAAPDAPGRAVAQQPTATQSPPPSPPARVVNKPPPAPNRAAAATSAPAPDPGSYAVHPNDFPDPFVFRAGPYWYAMSTQTGRTNVPMMRSLDLARWEFLGDALQSLPPWAAPGRTWAPAVLKRGSSYVLYYTARHAIWDVQCISVAVSVLPEGPYVDASPDSFVCQTDRGGSIDPSPFVDADGTPWLLWKSEGTTKGEPARLWSQRLAPNGVGLLGQPTELLRTERPWEGPIIEAPTMVRAGGRYHLFYSGNAWWTRYYAVGHAVCAGPAGPCRRSSDRAILGASGDQAGPGGAEVFVDDRNQLSFAYHAWSSNAVGYPNGARRLYLARVILDGDRAGVTRR